MTRIRLHAFGRGAAILALAATLSGCPKQVAVLGPVSDAGAVARRVESSTRLDGPRWIYFTWEANEAGSRLAGRGVGRVEPPYRARLDLFLDNGEAVVTAAVVGDELRLPYGARDDILPPVDLMWGTLGVFRPLSGTELIGGDRLEDGAERLRYRRADGTELHYRIERDGLTSVEWVERGTTIQWVRTESDADRYPTRATYRNLDAFRELRIIRDSLKVGDAFDPDIFDPRD